MPILEELRGSEEVRTRRVELERLRDQAKWLLKTTRAELKKLQESCQHPPEHVIERVIAFIPGTLRCGDCGKPLPYRSQGFRF